MTATATIYSRDARGRSLLVLEPPDATAVPAIGAELKFDEIYEDSGCSALHGRAPCCDRTRFADDNGRGLGFVGVAAAAEGSA